MTDLTYDCLAFRSFALPFSIVVHISIIAFISLLFDISIVLLVWSSWSDPVHPSPYFNCFPVTELTFFCINFFVLWLVGLSSDFFDIDPCTLIISSSMNWNMTVCFCFHHKLFYNAISWLLIDPKDEPHYIGLYLIPIFDRIFGVTMEFTFFGRVMIFKGVLGLSRCFS